MWLKILSAEASTGLNRSPFMQNRYRFLLLVVLDTHMHNVNISDQKHGGDSRSQLLSLAEVERVVEGL